MRTVPILLASAVSVLLAAGLLLHSGPRAVLAQAPTMSDSPPAVAPLPVMSGIHRSTFFASQKPYYRFRILLVNNNPWPSQAASLSLSIAPANQKKKTVYEETISVTSLAARETRRVESGKVTIPGKGRYLVHCSLNQSASSDRAFNF